MSTPLGPIGVFSVPLEVLPRHAATDFVTELDSIGYDAVWTGEGLGTREIFTNAAVILADTSQITFCAGIANVYARDPVTTVTATRTLLESFPGRFLLGLGVSHKEQVNPRGHTYRSPLETMRAYLRSMDTAPFLSPMPTRVAATAPVKRVLAALRPGMLALARDLADGAHPYMTTPEATARARTILGRGKLLAPEQAFLLETEPSRARRVARAYIAWYLGVENFRKSLLWQGFTESDLAGHGSDRLVDAIVAWGDEAAIRARVQAHFEAGADHVCVQAIADNPLDLGLEAYKRVAAALLS